jgi:class 3 adenylate cyclase
MNGERPYARANLAKGFEAYSVVANSHGTTPTERVYVDGRVILRVVNQTARAMPPVSAEVKADGRLIDWSVGENSDVVTLDKAGSVQLVFEVDSSYPRRYAAERSEAIAFRVKATGIEHATSRCICIGDKQIAMVSEFETYSEPTKKGMSTELDSTSSGRTPMKMHTVVELDMVAYSEIARTLDQAIGPDVVARLNDEIQIFVHRALETISLTPQNTVAATTGDGAILVFEDPVLAHRFAHHLFALSREFNANITSASALRLFRMGGATGNIVVNRRDSGISGIAGSAIADAVRLEGAAEPGQLVVDLRTYADLPNDLQAAYTVEDDVVAKHGQKFRVRRANLDATAKDMMKMFGTRKEKTEHAGHAGRMEQAADRLSAGGEDKLGLVTALESLAYPEFVLDHVMIAIEMPFGMRPGREVKHGMRCVEVINWCEHANKLETLKRILQFFLKKYSQ